MGVYDLVQRMCPTGTRCAAVCKPAVVTRPGLTSFLPDAPEHSVPPPAGQQQLPAELPWGLLVPAMDAYAGFAAQAITEATTRTMSAVPNLGHGRSSGTPHVRCVRPARPLNYRNPKRDQQVNALRHSALLTVESHAPRWGTSGAECVSAKTLCR